MRKILVLGCVALAMLACNMVLATPTQVIEMPTGTVVPEEEYNWGLDLRTTFGGGGAVGVRPGLTYGATEDFEIGVDWATNYPANGVLLNAKWRVTDEDKDDALAVGLMGVGLNFNQTPNVLYAVATLQDDDDDEDDDDTFNFHVGAYYGTNANYFGASQFGFMAGADFGDDEWRGIVEYMSGNNPLGVFSAGVGYMDEDNEWRAVLAYQYWLQQRQSGVTLQIDYFTD